MYIINKGQPQDFSYGVAFSAGEVEIWLAGYKNC